MNLEENPFIHFIKEDLTLFFKISFGVFLFVLFFEPFVLDRFDFNNLLVFVSGLGGIILVSMVLVRISMSLLVREYDKNNPEAVIPVYLEGFAILLLSSLGFTFYLKFVGSIPINFPVMFKIGFICLAPPVILYINQTIRGLKEQNKNLIREKGKMRKKAQKYEMDFQNMTISFVSETGTDALELQIIDIVFIKSADNYVEVAYIENNQIQKSLIRNTLKNIELQLEPYPNFLRCHRICIINEHFISSLHRDGTHWLSIKGTDEKLPVSRQYLLKLKEFE